MVSGGSLPLSPDAGARKPLAIALMGPTATGKTALAIALQRALGGEIISVDSALVYRGMDIVSAKPSARELRQAPHRLIDIRDPAEPYSAADFCRDARREIAAVGQQGRVPLLVGGTMLYFKALLEGLSDLPEADVAVRRDIEAQAARDGWPELHRLLAEVDPLSAQRIHPNHSQRIARALEVYRVSGRPLSVLQGAQRGGLLDQYDWVQLALAPRDRAALHQRISERFSAMLAAGGVQEVRALMARGDLHRDLPAIRAVGYRQLWEHLSGDYDYATMVAKGTAATRQLAKRQLTWLRGWSGLHWIDALDAGGAWRAKEEIIRETLNFLEKRAI